VDADDDSSASDAEMPHEGSDDEGIDGTWDEGWDDASDDDDAPNPRDVGLIKVRRAEAAAAGAIVTQLGSNIVRDVEAEVIPCIVPSEREFDTATVECRVDVVVLAAAREPCTITIGERVCPLGVGGVALIPAGVMFTRAVVETSPVFVPLEIILNREYDVIPDREAELRRPWDEIIDEREAGGTSRRGCRWTPEDDALLKEMILADALAGDRPASRA
jgi:hypothetical protein